MRRIVTPLLVIGLALTGAVVTGAPTTAVEPTAWNGVVLGDGFEYGLGDWSTTESGGASIPHWRRTGAGPGSGAFAAHIAGADKAADQSLTTAALPLGTSPQLVFRHRWQFERSQGISWDGGVIEFSTNDGATWQDLTTVGTVPYSAGTITNTSGNPLGGRQGFTGTSAGFPTYGTVTVPLTPLAGETVRFRFRFGADEAVASGGWWIDDVEITNSAPGAVVLPAAPTGVQVTPLSPTSAAVTFTPAGGSPSRPVVAHIATCTGGGRTATGTTRQTEIELSGLAAGAAYTCTVQGWTTAGVGPASAPASSAPTLATSRVASASTPAATGHRELTPAQRAALRSAAKPGTTTRVHDELGVPTVVWAADEGTVSAPGHSGERPAVAAARGHLARLAAAYRLSAQDVADARASGVHDLGHGAVIVQFAQEVHGVPVWHERINVVMTRDLGLVGLTGFLLPRNVTRAAVRLTSREALTAAFADLTGHQPTAIQPAGQRGGYDRFTSPQLLTPARAKRVLHRLPEGLASAYYVELRTTVAGTAREFGYVVSAADGSVLDRTDLVSDENADVDYRVWADPTTLQPYDGPQGSAGSPNPTGVPDGYQPSLTAPNLIQGPLTGDPWLGVGDTTTTGNNVDAYTDTAAPDGFTPDSTDLRPPMSAPGTFDYTYDFGLDPTANVTQARAALTQLFYDINYLHDWFYGSGFDEAAGNAQQNNYGPDGIDGDPILAEDQDNASTTSDNANMSTPADGGSPRMQMYVWTGPSDAGLELTPGGSVPVGVAAFGPQTFDVTGDVVVAADAGGVSTTDGCDAPITNVAGKVAVVDRGVCTFQEKANNLQDAGAVGMILANDRAGVAPNMGGGCSAACPATTIGVVSVSQDDGAALKQAIGNGTVSAHLHRASLPRRDGALDTTIVAHEWGHYLSNRLAALGNQQATAMGEGWSDFVALLLMVQPEDVAALDGAFPVGAYASAAFTHPYEYYFGIRRMPYSTDFTINPLTFKHIGDEAALPNDVPIAPNGVPNSEVHNAGEVWASMLWECYAGLLADTTGPTPRLSFDAARSRMKDYLVESLKATPANPTFLEARDALLLAAIASDQADYQVFLEAFALRGAGLGAVAPARDSTNFAGVVESNSFEITPPTTSVALSGGTLGGNGWYTAAPTAAVTAASGFVLAPTTRCVLDDPTHATFADLPDDPREPCDYLAPGARLPEGVHTVYAASTDVADQVSQVTSSTVKVDSEPPELECQPAEFYTDQVGAQVLATVSDPTSGPVEGTAASVEVDTSSPGSGTMQVTGHDVAGHSTDAFCDYTVVGDTTPPTVSLSSGAGLFVRGTVTLTATVADDFAVDHVTFTVDAGTPSNDATAPYTLALNTTLLPDGQNAVSALAVDPSNNQSTVATVNLTVDNHAPPKPGLTALPAFTKGASTVLHYSGTDPGSGIASYTIQVRKAAYTATGLPAAWANLGTVTGTALTANALVRGTTYCFRVLARDKAGNVSVPSTQTCTARLVDDPALKRSAGWFKVSGAGFDGGSASRTTKASVTLSLANVHARRLALRASTCPTCGSVKVLVGTTLVKTISLVSTTKKTAVLFTITLPKAMTGTVRITTRSAKVVTIDGLGLSHS